MKTLSRTISFVLALVVVGGGASKWVAAQETSSSSSGTVSGQVAATPGETAKDNGAMPGDSHVRIVRLSDAKGTLGLDRKTGHGFEQTMQNMPIVEGERLQTADGYAEVEFEDNSTLRLAPSTRVDFPLLALRSSGAKASTMRVVGGTVYVSTESTKGNEFMLEVGETKMVVSPSTHLRVEVNESRTVLSVFNGSVEVQRGAETSLVTKKESLTLGANQMALGKKIEEQPYDAWDKESLDYHQRYAAANTFAGGGNSFGLSDLNYYGSFVNAGGFGSFWQPYFAGSGWSPYANGLWALYPGAGYSWVSPYPWGWLPYHSGSWSYFPGYGWGWQPGGSFNGLNNVVAPGTGVATAGVGSRNPVSSPLRAGALPTPPVAGATRQSLVMANEKPIVMSQQDKSGNFVFQRDSAGLGVPRGSLGGLNKISNDVVRHGSRSMEVYAAAPSGSGRVESRGPATLRAGSPDGAAGTRGSDSALRRGGFDGAQASQAGQVSSASRGGGSQSSAPAPMSMPAPAATGGAAGGGGARGPISSPK